MSVSQVFTVDRGQLVERIKRLASERIRDVVAGLKLVIEPREPA